MQKMVDVLTSEFANRNVQPTQSGFRDQVARDLFGGADQGHVFMFADL